MTAPCCVVRPCTRTAKKHYHGMLCTTMARWLSNMMRTTASCRIDVDYMLRVLGARAPSEPLFLSHLTPRETETLSLGAYLGSSPSTTQQDVGVGMPTAVVVATETKSGERSQCLDVHDEPYFFGVFAHATLPTAYHMLCVDIPKPLSLMECTCTN